MIANKKKEPGKGLDGHINLITARFSENCHSY